MQGYMSIHQVGHKRSSLCQERTQKEHDKSDIYAPTSDFKRGIREEMSHPEYSFPPCDAQKEY